MTDDKLIGMSEAQIRARYRGAPAYFLQAKLERRRALQGRPPGTSKSEPPARIQSAAQSRSKAREARAEPPRETRPARESTPVDVALPGFEILDAALSRLDDPHAAPTQDNSRGNSQASERTQQAILEEALEDYSNWPLIGGDESAVEPRSESKTKPRTSTRPTSDLEQRLAELLEAEPELELVLESEPDLAPPTLSAIPDNVTVGAFGGEGSGNVRVVSVAMDRKRPYMVRVIGKTTRHAS